MVETANYRVYQPDSVAPPIPIKKPRPSSILMMNSPRYVPPQPPMTTSQHAHYTSYDQYGSDRLHPNHTHRREVSGFSTYQLQQNLLSITTNVNAHDLARRLGPTSSTTSPHSQRHYSVPANYSQDTYVATLRKQKATVWCELAQAEDPRIMAAQRVAKTRATMEVTGLPYTQDINTHGFGGSSSNSPTSSLYGGTSGHAAAGVGGGVNTMRKKAWVKDRSGSSHGSSKKIVMDPGSLIVGAVPTRLSASEVMGDSSDEDVEMGTRRSRRAHRASFNSTHRQSLREYERSRRSAEGLRHTNSTGSKSSAGSSAYSAPRSIAEEEEESPEMTGNPPTHSEQSSLRYSPRDMSGLHSSHHQLADYFLNPPPTARRTTSGYTSTTSSPDGAADGLGPLPTGLRVEKMRTPASLRRSGSVDEREARTRTMSGVRLFVANPDAS